MVRLVSAAGAIALATSFLPSIASFAAQPNNIADAQAQIDELDNQAEVASEEFNGAQINLAQAQEAVTAATAATVRAHSVVVAEQAKVSALAVEAYESGGLSQGLALVLDTASPSDAMNRIAVIQQLSSRQSTMLSAVRTADLNYQQSMVSAGQATAAANAVTATLSQKQAQINAAIAQSQQVLAHLTAVQRAQLLAAQKAKQAAEQARAAVALANYKRDQAAAASRNLARAAAATRTAQAAQAAFAALPENPGGSAVARRAVAAAMSKLGARYVFGAGGARYFDCSGLVQWAYGQAGISTAHYTGTFWNNYRHVAVNQLQPGDLVFFYRDHHHVGIYIGGGMMVNAPHTGDVVKVASVLGHGNYSGAVRLVG
jgi:cell wall-associated NlpC family hydrolase